MQQQVKFLTFGKWFPALATRVIGIPRLYSYNSLQALPFFISQHFWKQLNSSSRNFITYSLLHWSHSSILIEHFICTFVEHFRLLSTITFVPAAFSHSFAIFLSSLSISSFVKHFRLYGRIFNFFLFAPMHSPFASQTSDHHLQFAHLVQACSFRYWYF